MGLLNEMVKGLSGKFLGGGGQNPLLETVLGLITNPQTGGLEGLVQNFKNRGMNDIISSWISTGKNMPVSDNQIQNALGMDQILQIAKQFGASKEEVSGGLASLLPEIIDKLTPNGALPGADALDQGLNRLKKDLLGS
jgi:uncharacterized protein YidB (DUF937 family)